MNGNNEHWSLGILLGVPAAILVILVGLAILGYAIHESRQPYPDAGLFYWIGGVLVVGTLLISAFAYWPYVGEYHQWRPVDGTVASIDSRLISAGDKGGTNQRFVVTFNGSDMQYSCDDTRCAQVKPGDFLALSCKRSWQWAGTPGYDCNFYGRRQATG